MRAHLLGVMVLGLAAIVLPQAAQADWDPGMPAKYFQLPDLTPSGIDIRDDQNAGLRRIADDFPCKETGPVTDVHIWGSWLDDLNGGINYFTLRFWSNNPQGPGGFSVPAALLWEGDIVGPAGTQTTNTKGRFTERLYKTVEYEHFWDPVTGVWGKDTQVLQYNMNIDPALAFVQQGTPTSSQTYWLEVQAFTSSTEGQFGWKTRDPQDGHYMDDAVYWVQPAVGGPGNWNPLEYQTGGSIDMAFVITPEPATMALLGLGIAGLVARRRSKK